MVHYYRLTLSEDPEAANEEMAAVSAEPVATTNKMVMKPPPGWRHSQNASMDMVERLEAQRRKS